MDINPEIVVVKQEPPEEDEGTDVIHQEGNDAQSGSHAKAELGGTERRAGLPADQARLVGDSLDTKVEWLDEVRNAPSETPSEAEDPLSGPVTIKEEPMDAEPSQTGTPRASLTKLGSRLHQNPAASEEVPPSVKSRQSVQKGFELPVGLTGQADPGTSSLSTPVDAVVEDDVHGHDRPGSTVLSLSEEKFISSHIVLLMDCGFPITKHDVRVFVREYFDSLGRSERRVYKKDNMPGVGWVEDFIVRHRQISERVKKITCHRAHVNTDRVNSYFDYLSVTLNGVPPSNIWNFDEINLQDYPESGKVLLLKRGVRHADPDPSSKSAAKAPTTIMLCGNAAGELAPFYVVYKAEGVYPGWTVGGPEGARYNHSPTGWIDGRVFEDWFEFTMLPLLKRQAGTKVLIGDIFTSQLNPRVLTACQANDIKIAALPANSNRLLQPLYVTGLDLIVKWKNILNDWKVTPEGNRLMRVPKTLFPALLHKLVAALRPDAVRLLKSGFGSSGTCPLNRSIPLSRLESLGNDLKRSAELREKAHTTVGAPPADAQPLGSSPPLKRPTVPGSTDAHEKGFQYYHWQESV